MGGRIAGFARYGGLQPAPAFTAIALAAGLLLDFPADAQTSSSTASTTINSPCSLGLQPVGDQGLPILFANCGQRGVILGPASSYQTFTNAGLGATLVDIRTGAERRILLLGLKADGEPTVENLNGAISMKAGNGPMTAIDKLRIDLSGFASTATITVSQNQQSSSGPSATTTLDIGQQVAAERSLASGVDVQN